MAIPTLTVMPHSVAQAYKATDVGAPNIGGAGGGFGNVLSKALESVVNTSRTAETQAKMAISGQANITEVATAVAKAELALQTTVALRDKMVNAYQEIMRMPI